MGFCRKLQDFGSLSKLIQTVHSVDCAHFVLKPTSFQLTQAYSSQSSHFWSSPDFVDTFRA